jgi:hypothetical protein
MQSLVCGSLRGLYILFPIFFAYIFFSCFILLYIIGRWTSLVLTFLLHVSALYLLLMYVHVYQYMSMYIYFLFKNNVLPIYYCALYPYFLKLSLDEILYFRPSRFFSAKRYS